MVSLLIDVVTAYCNQFLVTDIDECAVLTNPCGKQAICENTVPGYNCLCPQGYDAQPTPDIACEQVRIRLASIFDGLDD